MMKTAQIPVERHTLPNGLRLVHSYNPTTAMAAVDVLYNVGSRDESRSHTGLAHLFEHLMFGGSRDGIRFDRVLERAGGVSNAWTNNDFTNFYETIPARNIDTALFLESGRMLRPPFTEADLAVQRGVVAEEFKERRDAPFGDLPVLLYDLAYGSGHPYSWPVIGLELEHIEQTTMDDARRWFYSHYAPDNAVIAIAGGVPFDRGLALVEEWFGDIPARGIAPRPAVDPGFPTAPVVRTVRRDVPFPVVSIAYPMDAFGTKGYFAADTLTDILSVGRSARLYNNLVNGSGSGLVTDADASVAGTADRGILVVDMMLSDNSDAAIGRAIDLLDKELKEIARPGNISGHELERTLNKFEADLRFRNLGSLEMVEMLARAEMLGFDINSVVSDRRRLTPADIESESAQIFARPSATLVYRPR